MKEVKLKRTGDAPVCFLGEVIAAKYSAIADRKQTITIYRVVQNRFAVSVDYSTKWPSEHDRHTVVVCKTSDEARKFLRDHDPVPPNIGYPPGEKYAERQSRLIADLRGAYARLVSEVLESAGAVENVDGGDSRADRLRKAIEQVIEFAGRNATELGYRAEECIEILENAIAADDEATK